LISILLDQSEKLPKMTVVLVDLSNAGTFRGDIENDGQPQATLPRKLDELNITLPRFSPLGRYVFAILKSRSESAAIALGSATATGNEARVTLAVTLDLSVATPGRYFLATRREEQGQEQAAYYYLVLISAHLRGLAGLDSSIRRSFDTVQIGRGSFACFCQL
jgi:hypothetical protein